MPSIIANPVARAYRCCPLAGTHRKLRAAQRRHAPRVAGRCQAPSADLHSPDVHGFLWSHVGWFLTPRNFRTDLSRVPDLAKYPELCWLDRCDRAIPVVLAVVLHASGVLLHHVAPQLGARGGQMLIWGVVSTIVLFHATVTINSLAHRFGRGRYGTMDDSCNTCGRPCPPSAKAGLRTRRSNP